MDQDFVSYFEAGRARVRHWPFESTHGPTFGGLVGVAHNAKYTELRGQRRSVFRRPSGSSSNLTQGARWPGPRHGAPRLAAVGHAIRGQCIDAKLRA